MTFTIKHDKKIARTDAKLSMNTWVNRLISDVGEPVWLAMGMELPAFAEVDEAQT